MEKSNISTPSKALSLDTTVIIQPKDTYRFALNTVNETEEGDIGFLSNEESNEAKITLTTGLEPISQLYTVDNNIVLFSCNPTGTVSEIGIIDKNDVYTTIVNDTDSVYKLNFSSTYPIQATYRLRKGCERTIYFVSDNNKPRYFNFDKPNSFKTNNKWDARKFELFRSYQNIPVFESIKIESGGNLTSGSYNFAIQYLDEDLNPTEWITSSETIMIYKDINKSFNATRGSTGTVLSYRDFGKTNKAIRLTFDALDTTFPFYRIGIVQATSETGLASNVFASEEISTSIPQYLYTGDSVTNITEEEILLSSPLIERVETLEQVENRLILGGITGKQVNFCKLQQYASQIQSDCRLSAPVILNDLNDTGNSKRGEHHVELTGYMPGEIYSFGIVYIFKDNTLSPVYHIPGKNVSTINKVFVSETDIETGALTFPMSTNNTLQSTYPVFSGGCSDFWGKDAQGSTLVNTPIRHHRFPLRSEMNLPLVVKEEVNSTTLLLHKLSVRLTGSIDLTTYTDSLVRVYIEYTLDGQAQVAERSFTAATFNINTGLVLPIISTTQSIVVTSTSFRKANGAIYGAGAGLDLLIANNTILDESRTFTGDLYRSQMLGIKFSNILTPSKEEIGDEIIGYYIVRNERTENNKTILDTAILTPLQEETYFVAHAHLYHSEGAYTPTIRQDMFGFINPEFMFKKQEYGTNIKFIKQGEFRYSGSALVAQDLLQDVLPGTSYNAETSKRREKDSDGFSLHTLTKYREVDYYPSSGTLIAETDVEDVFYLDSLYSKKVTTYNAQKKEVFNVSEDNRIGIVQLNKALSLADTVTNKNAYVTIFENKQDIYSNFTTLPYYKESKNPTAINVSEIDIFNGDSYVSPITYTSSTMYDMRLRKRSQKSGLWRAILGVVSIIAGVVVSVLGNPAAGLMIAGWGIKQLATGLKIEQMSKVYNELYEKGLKNCIEDQTTKSIFGPNPADDTVQWFSSTLSGLWFESSINMNWRVGNTNGIHDFSNPLEPFDPAIMGKTLTNKLTVLDTENENGVLYQGFCNAEIYHLNKDYARRNKQKIFYSLGIEYDCCSNCLEKYPHRVHYSEQSFQEELSDNYRTFLPNNYRDIEGETGEITNIFKIGNNLFIHTQEALWQLPNSYQERVTDQIVSFIGTGTFFELPPRKILDDSTGNSGGCQHKRSFLKTPHGVFFISENQGMVYSFNGNQLTPISNQGLSSWFTNDIPVQLDKEYLKTFNKRYPFRDNPSKKEGTGYHMVYDSLKQRVIITKQDATLLNILQGYTDYQLCFSDEGVTVFNNSTATIAAQVALGWTYLGIENCRLKFEREVTQNVTNTVETRTWVPEQLIMGVDPNCVYASEINIVVPGGNTGGSEWLEAGFTYCDGTEVSSGQSVAFGSASFTWTPNACVLQDSLWPEGTITTPVDPPTCGEVIIGVIPGYWNITTEEVTTQVVSKEYTYINGILKNQFKANNASWTISYSLKTQGWVSWHSYLPQLYLQSSNTFYSYITPPTGPNYIWKHNKKNTYQTFYGNLQPHIIEFVSVSNPLTTRVWEDISLITEAKTYDAVTEEYIEARNVTFNKAVLYNSRQCSGEMALIPKDELDGLTYFGNLTVNTNDGVSIIDKTEKTWHINDFRDIRVNYSIPIWISHINLIQNKYYIDKILNAPSLSVTKNWTELESFMDKYLVVRLIFDNFADVKLITNFSIENEHISLR